MDIPTEYPLFQCRYLPRYFIGLIFIPAIFIVLAQHSLSSYTRVHDFSSLIQYLLHQSMPGWLVLTLVIMLALIAINMKLVVTSQSISIQSFGIKLNDIVQRNRLLKTQLYSSYISRYRAHKPLTAKAFGQEQLWKVSRLGFILKPEFRKQYKMAHIDLNMLNKDNRKKLIQILAKHYDLDPKFFLGRAQLARQKLQHKLR
ncbi:hypothetical protein H0920_09660 [Acinetobacter sp. C_4_1]|uniref:hypothetical protein n=1 Tax=unclassified Acinetobacter TaxID=196816 RepID=UPI0021B72D1A|nr:MULTISPECIES: hypothetical protein [unclassified Acinetobacter]MCT8089836.1 hypothetical protein [Acinetobacter sp. F_3_1]MCT8098527.1 hypothetical protein [Acinetobacter sp. C_3_1]MCT8101365.1 hypothetical protein [Acinetobacter sp. C_4_1]MCT8135308.1 hypothetical protein [Acinetobacter sp. T_3_1]